MTNPWHIPDPTPTTLLVAWSAEQAPTRAEMLAMFGAAAGGIDDLGEIEMADAVWNAVTHPAGLPVRVLLFCERSIPLPIEEKRRHDVHDPPWVIGVQTILDPEDPVASYAALLRLIGAALPEAPFVLDADSEVILPRARWSELFLAVDAYPPADVLWSIHAVGDGRSPDGPMWLFTSGLHRCGRPELELVEIPAALANAGELLIDVAAETLLEAPVPPPGEPLNIVFDHPITVQPWREVVPFVPDGAPGSLAHRNQAADDGGLLGTRAVICDATPRGEFRKVWSWPRGALSALAGGVTMVRRPERATRRAEQLARATWPDLAMAFADARRTAAPAARNGLKFLVKAAFDENGSGDREHLWFDVTRFEGDRAEGRLVNRPVHVQSLREGDVTWVERAQVSDWGVTTPAGRFEPGRRAGLREAIESWSRT